MKKRVIATSLMSIAMLASIATGATYALFTAEDTVNVAVNAGKVNVDALVEETTLKTYSMGVEQAKGTFENGGTAVIKENGDLDLNLLTPGDRATFTVKIDNNSNVNIKYRVVLSVEGELASGLVTKVVFNDREYPLAGGKTGWFSLAAGADIPDVTVDIELPVEAGNEYQDKKANISVRVEAIQGNAETTDEWNGKRDTNWYEEEAAEYVIYTAEELAGFAALVNGAEGNLDTFAGKTVKLGDNIDLKGINWTAIGDPMSEDYVGFAGTFDGQGYTISNLTIDNKAYWGQGLFGYNTNKTTTIKNFTIENVNINTEDTSGAVAGYFQFGTFENVSVTGDIEITGAQHMGGIVGNGYYTNISGCSVVGNDGSSITTTSGSFAGGIIGYHGGSNLEITNSTVKNLEITGKAAVGGISGHEGAGNLVDGCLVEDVKLTKTSVESLPSVGVASGTWDGNANNPITFSNNTFKNSSLNGKYTEVKEYEFNEIFGTPYDAGLINGAVVETNNTKENVVNNLEKMVKTVKINNKEELLEELANVTEEIIIDATGVELAVNAYNEIVVPAGVTIVGASLKFNPNCNVIGVVSNFGDAVTFENCTFEGNNVLIGNDTSKEHSNYIFNNCDFSGDVMSAIIGKNNVTAEFNNCTFGLFEGFKGLVCCLGGTQTFNNCEFNFLGGYEYNSVIQPCGVTAYSENYSTHVTLNGCSGNYFKTKVSKMSTGSATLVRK